MKDFNLKKKEESFKHVEMNNHDIDNAETIDNMLIDIA